MLLSLLVIALFVISCALKEGDEALAGQAVKVYTSCTDLDNGTKEYIPGYAVGNLTKGGIQVGLDLNQGNKVYERRCIGGQLAAKPISCPNGLVNTSLIVVETGKSNIVWACKCTSNEQCGAGYVCGSDGICKKEVVVAPTVSKVFCYYINSTGGNYYTQLWSTGTVYDYVATEKGNFTKYCEGDNLLEPRCGVAGEGNIADQLVTNYNTYFIGGEGVSLGVPHILEKCTSGCNITTKQCNPTQSNTNDSTQTAITVESTIENYCVDGLDNDADGKIDCADTDCEGKTCSTGKECKDGACVPTCTPKVCVYQANAGGVKDCGIKDDGCGGTINCNYQAYVGGLECPTGEECQSGQCVNVPVPG